MSKVTLNKKGQLEASIGDAVRRVCTAFNKDTATTLQYRVFRGSWPVAFNFEQLPDFLEGRITLDPLEGTPANMKTAATIVDVVATYDHEDRLTDIVVKMEFAGPLAELLRAAMALEDAEVHISAPKGEGVTPVEFTPYFEIQEI